MKRIYIEMTPELQAIARWLKLKAERNERRRTRRAAARKEKLERFIKEHKRRGEFWDGRMWVAENAFDYTH